MAMRVSGLNSGLDTDSIVKELVNAHSLKKDKYVKQQTLLEWKQDKWKDLNTKFYNLLTKTLDSVRFSSAYNKKATVSSNPSRATVTADTSVNNGTQELEVISLAKSGYLTGGKLDQGGTKASGTSTLADLGYTGGNGNIAVNSGGNTVNIAVNEDTTVSDFVSQLKNAGLSASFDEANQRIFIGAKESGADNDFALTGTDASGMQALGSFGVLVNSSANDALTASWKGYGVSNAGVLDEAATKANLESILLNMEAKRTENANLTDDISELRDKNLAASDARKYAVDRVNARNILDKISDPSVNKDRLQELLAMSEEDLNAGTGANKIELEGLTMASGLTAEDLNSLKQASTSIATYETNADTPEEQQIVAELDTIMAQPAATVTTEMTQFFADIDAGISANETEISNKQKQMVQNNVILEKDKLLTQSVDSTLTIAEQVDALYQKVDFAVNQASSVTASAGATRVDGQNAKFKLNGADFESTSNTLTVNGLTITALEAAPGEVISLTTGDDTQAIYDTIKGFVKEYNTLMKEMDKLYNASSSKGYDPLTSDEKSEMTDDEIEKWETKIKDSMLRRDDSISSLMTMMSSSMSKVYEVDGKKYSLASFGIMTSKYGEAAENERYLFHIDGDSDDLTVSSKSNSLMNMLQTDPDAVEGFFQQLTQGLYEDLNDKMKRTDALKSTMSIYNDKKMTEDIKQAKKAVTKWEDKLTYYEEYYYNKFTAMETAMAKLQSNTNSLSQLMGM